MFVLKEKLINSILIKVKGKLCVLYSCLISFPSQVFGAVQFLSSYGKRGGRKSVVCIRAFPFPRTSTLCSFYCSYL